MSNDTQTAFFVSNMKAQAIKIPSRGREPSVGLVQEVSYIAYEVNTEIL